MLQERYVGSDQSSIEQHKAKIELWKEYEREKLAALEEINLTLCQWAIKHGLNFAFLAFGVLIDTMDGNPIKDYSEENLIKVIAALQELGLTPDDIRTNLSEINETLEREVKQTFPESIDKQTLINWNSFERKRQLLMHQFIQTGNEDLLKEINQIEKRQSKYLEPKNLNPHDPQNELKLSDANFENNCISLEGNGVSEPKKLTVYEFKKRLQFYTPKNGQVRQTTQK